MTERNTDIVESYIKGDSARIIAERYNVTTRHIQRIIKNAGKSRTISQSFRLAIQTGRMKYTRKPEHLRKHRTRLSDKLRFAVFQRDNFKCVMCGSTAKECHRLEVDHIDNDPSNHDEHNLQLLCDRCNKGKSYNT